MVKSKYKILIGFLFFSFLGFSQIKGVVRGVKGDDTLMLNGVKITQLETGKKNYSNTQGKFELWLGKSAKDTLVFSYAGYYSDTLVVGRQERFLGLSIFLYEGRLIREVVIQKKAMNGIMKLSIPAIEKITLGELQRAACCNLSESFETNASVDVNITDAVSGARRIQLLGLDGVYTQIQLENIPFLRGLETAYGMQSFSGLWLNGIQISKGTGSVVNGHESMAGLINLEAKNPMDEQKTLVNGYINRFGRSEGNWVQTIRLNGKWSTALLTNASINAAILDENKDGFVDIPKFANASVMNRWQYNGQKMEAQCGVYSYTDKRLSGQLAAGLPLGAMPYTMKGNNQHIEGYAKTGFFGKHPGESVGIIQSVKLHRIDGSYGLRNFRGEESRYFISSLYERESSSGKHRIKGGASLGYLAMLQEVDPVLLSRRESTISGFSEYSLQSNRLSLQTGFRVDYHTLLGWFWIPRVHMKWALTPRMDLRFTAGKGWRAPNVLMENIALLANQKNWVFSAELKPEVSWNAGTSLVIDFDTKAQRFTWTSDVYYTWFEKQLVADRDVQPLEIHFTYLEKASYALAMQSEIDLQINALWGMRLAYKFLDVKALYDGTMQQQPMVPRHRLLGTFSWNTKNKRWQADLTMNFVGSMRMPSSFSGKPNSPWFPNLFSQVSHQWKRLKAYIGFENMLHFRQDNPIHHAEDPWSPSFDASMVWGPITGFNVYAGATYVLKHKNK